MKNDLIEEYKFLSKKILQLGLNWRNEKGNLKRARLFKKGRQFVKRLREIEGILEDHGVSPSDILDSVNPTINNVPPYTNRSMGLPMGKNIMPDGTLFQTPKIEGSFLDREPLVKPKNKDS
jgi:hypothetical protein